MKAPVDFAKAKGEPAPKKSVMNLKSQLRLLLDHRGMTPAELSRKSGVSKQVLSLWLAGSKPKNIDQIKKVADVFGVTIDHLLFGEVAKIEKGQGLEALFRG